MIALQQAQQETDKQVKETSQQMKSTDKYIKELGKMLGGIGNSQGDVAEEFFYNSLGKKPTLGGIDYDFIDKNVTRKKDDIEDEYDILLINGQDVAIIEVKYKAHQQDLDRLIDKKYKNFKLLYPQYKNYQHHLALASFKINDNLKQQALNKNVAVLQRKGDIVETTLPSV
ncbi:MAG: hypothetical protein DRQ51_09245 [Gammaproteobacteria bacterium]|nr:MAG: hypothetical protein DRQ51_09245 [Gammaproteobacteria bacterium]